MVLNFLKSFYVDKKVKKTNFKEKIIAGTKLHTIREDRNNKWHTDRPIHYATGARSSRYNCFKRGFCVSVQRIVIRGRDVRVDNDLMTDSEIEDLAINDGFDSVIDFWVWFDQYKEGFEGKLIHWTNLKY